MQIELSERQAKAILKNTTGVVIKWKNKTQKADYLTGLARIEEQLKEAKSAAKKCRPNVKKPSGHTPERSLKINSDASFLASYEIEDFFSGLSERMVSLDGLCFYVVANSPRGITHLDVAQKIISYTTGIINAQAKVFKGLEILVSNCEIQKIERFNTVYYYPNHIELTT